MTQLEPTVILVIDGDNVRRGLIACSLPPDRYAVEFAKTPEAGLDCLARIRPAVVVVGYSENTADLCQRIRNLPAGDRCLLMLMGERFHEHGSDTEAEAAGADIALPFPFDTALFDAHLARFAEPFGAATTTPHPRDVGPPPEEEVDRAPSPVASGEEWVAFRQRVDQFYDRLDHLDYYQLLEVPRSATAAAVKNAYFDRSMEFHPDRFVQLGDEELKGRIYEVYKRISEAFRILIRPETRIEYDRELEAPIHERSLRYEQPAGARSMPGPSEPDGAQTPAGRRYFQFAQLARQEGNLKSARMYLTLAIQCEPENPSLRHHLQQITERLS